MAFNALAVEVCLLLQGRFLLRTLPYSTAFNDPILMLPSHHRLTNLSHRTLTQTKICVHFPSFVKKHTTRSTLLVPGYGASILPVASTYLLGRPAKSSRFNIGFGRRSLQGFSHLQLAIQMRSSDIWSC